MDIRKAFLELELPASASKSDAKRAYRRLIKRWHPDRFQSDPDRARQAESRAKQLNVAYRTLVDHFGWRRPRREQRRPCWWWGEADSTPSSRKSLSRRPWFRGFAFEDVAFFRDDIEDWAFSFMLVSMGFFPFFGVLSTNVSDGVPLFQAFIDNFHIALIGVPYVWVVWKGMRGSTG